MRITIFFQQYRIWIFQIIKNVKITLYHSLVGQLCLANHGIQPTVEQRVILIFPKGQRTHLVENHDFYQQNRKWCKPQFRRNAGFQILCPISGDLHLCSNLGGFQILSSHWSNMPHHSPETKYKFIQAIFLGYWSFNTTVAKQKDEIFSVVQSIQERLTLDLQQH